MKEMASGELSCVLLSRLGPDSHSATHATSKLYTNSLPGYEFLAKLMTFFSSVFVHLKIIKKCSVYFHFRVLKDIK